MTTDLDLIRAIQAVVDRWQQATLAWDPSWASMAEIRDRLADWAQETQPPLHRPTAATLWDGDWDHRPRPRVVSQSCVHCGLRWPCPTAKAAAQGRPIAEPVILERADRP